MHSVYIKVLIVNNYLTLISIKILIKHISRNWIWKQRAEFNILIIFCGKHFCNTLYVSLSSGAGHTGHNITFRRDWRVDDYKDQWLLFAVSIAVNVDVKKIMWCIGMKGKDDSNGSDTCFLGKKKKKITNIYLPLNNLTVIRVEWKMWSCWPLGPCNTAVFL